MCVGQDHEVALFPQVGLDQRHHIGLVTDHESVLKRYFREQGQEEITGRGVENGHAAGLPGLGGLQPGGSPPSRARTPAGIGGLRRRVV